MRVKIQMIFNVNRISSFVGPYVFRLSTFKQPVSSCLVYNENNVDWPCCDCPSERSSQWIAPYSEDIENGTCF